MFRELVVAFLLGSAPAVLAAAVGSDRQFIVYVVGANVPAPQPPEEVCADVPGDVLYYGARLALHHLAENLMLKEVKPEEPKPKEPTLIIRLEKYNDGGCAEDAGREARRLSKDPQVLAVIGHATSATTRAAALQYVKAGIPLLAPMATSPRILYPNWPDLSTHLPNVFRLPPGDDTVQGPTVAYVVQNILTPKRYVVVQDASTDALYYSEPLVDSILGFLGGERIRVSWDRRRKETEGTALFEGVALKIWNQKPDLIIMCAYPDTVKALLRALKTRYESLPRPTLLLTDGAREPDLDVSPFEAYLTYPVPAIKSDLHPERLNAKYCTGAPGASLDANPDLDELRDDIRNNDRDEYELFAYDAMSILAQVVLECGKESSITRSCVLEKLKNDRGLIGAASVYSFLGGENPLSAYHLYAVSKNQFQYCRGIEPSTLKRFIQKAEAKK